MQFEGNHLQFTTICNVQFTICNSEQPHEDLHRRGRRDWGLYGCTAGAGGPAGYADRARGAFTRHSGARPYALPRCRSTANDTPTEATQSESRLRRSLLWLSSKMPWAESSKSRVRRDELVTNARQWRVLVAVVATRAPSPAKGCRRSGYADSLTAAPHDSCRLTRDLDQSAPA